jgi:Methyltransferase domain
VTELLLGCGFSRVKYMALPGAALDWKDLTTCDINPKCEPDILCDLNDNDEWRCQWKSEQGRAALDMEWPRQDVYPFGGFKEAYFDEVHAYEVLEHLGAQGDATAFFNCFANIHRVLCAGGHLFATCPSRYSPWLWGDPSHRRVISAESLAFLDQRVVASNRKNGTAMSDFSDLWTRDFRIISAQDNRQTFAFCLQAIK